MGWFVEFFGNLMQKSYEDPAEVARKRDERLAQNMEKRDAE
jgi:hypothetical protein